MIRSLTIGGLMLAMSAGCQRYEHRPLDLEAHRAAWAQRDPAGQEIAAFAQRFSNGSAHDAMPFDPIDGLSLAEAEVVALVFNPELRMARLRVSVAKASAQFAGLWADPVFDLDVLRIIEGVPEPWILATSLGFTIPLSGRLEAEKAKANAEFQAEIARAAQREWEIVNELRRAWTEWSAAMLKAEVAAELESRLAMIVSTTDRLEQVGELPLIESRLFQIEASNRASEARELSGEASQLELQIKAILGLRPESPVTLAISLDADTNESESVEAELEHRSASLIVVRAEYEVAEQNLRTEIRKQYPDLTIGPAYENEEDQSRIGIGGSFPIPLLNRNRQGIAEAEAEREFARASYETQYEQAIHELAQARAELAYRRQLREDFEVRVIPLVEAQVENARRMLELGEVDTLVQLESLIRLSEAKLRIVEIRMGEALASNRVTAIAGPRWEMSVDTRGAQ